jgi:hypothetical protein
MNRREFVELFLEALGAKEIVYSEINENSVRGTVIYEHGNFEEKQDFIWHALEDEIPSEHTVRLIKVLKEEELLDIDRIKPTREELRVIFNDYYKQNMDKQSFERIINSLERINIKMVDEGEETDSFLIHE